MKKIKQVVRIRHISPYHPGTKTERRPGGFLWHSRPLAGGPEKALSLNREGDADGRLPLQETNKTVHTGNTSCADGFFFTKSACFSGNNRL